MQNLKTITETEISRMQTLLNQQVVTALPEIEINRPMENLVVLQLHNSFGTENTEVG